MWGSAVKGPTAFLTLSKTRPNREQETMNDPQARRKFIFTVTAGRTGTHYLTKLLSDNLEDAEVLMLLQLGERLLGRRVACRVNTDV